MLLACCSCRKTFVSVLLFHLLIVHATKVQIDHAQKGRAYGSQYSVDVVHKIAVGDDGFLYIGGDTFSTDSEHESWGDTEAGEVTGKTDTFLAKLSPAGSLLWVRRTGSKEDDFLGDMKIIGDAIYFCGSTNGLLGKTLNGSADVFIMKLSLQGEWIWRRPFTFGSRGVDVCHSFAVDESIFVVGSTSGPLFLTTPSNGSVHQFIARLEEHGNQYEGLTLIKGRQRNGFGSSTAIAVGTTQDSVYYVSINWTAMDADKERVTTYLNIADKDAVILHKLQVLKPQGSDSFRGVAMDVVQSSGDAFIVGISKLSNGRESYHAVKYSPSVQDNVGGIAWETYLGLRSRGAPLKNQRLSIACDLASGRVFIAGVENGVYKDADNTSNIMSVPIFVLDMQSGSVVETWNRWTDIGYGQQEVTDLAINVDGTGVVAGSWDVGPGSSSKAWLATLGSSRLAFQLQTETDVTLEKSSERQMVPTEAVSRSRVVPLIAFISGIMTVCFLTLIFRVVKNFAESINEQARPGIPTVTGKTNKQLRTTICIRSGPARADLPDKVNK